MRARMRLLMSAVGIAALTMPIVSGGSAGAVSDKPRAFSVLILGADHFVHPGLFINDYRFDDENIVVERGSTITFKNKTTDGHTIALVTGPALPKNTADVDNCQFGNGATVCSAVNGVFFGPNQGGPGGPPVTPQIDNGKPNDDAQADADALDTGAINNGGGSLPPGFPPLLIEDFDTASTATTVGDATIVAPPGRGPVQRTIVMTAAPGLYHYMCTLHPWMQGTIQVVS